MNAHFGSVSHGTLRSEDLISSFSGELADMPGVRSNKETVLLAECDAWEEFDEENEDSAALLSHEEQGSELVNDLIDALQEYAPAYAYFGTHPGDGADFGFWLSESFPEEFDGRKVSDLADVEDSYRGEILVVNDHGNMTLYVTDGPAHTLREIWAVV